MDTHHLTEHLKVALSALPEGQRQALSWRYGIGNGKEHSPKELSKPTGLAPQRIATREASGIRGLRRPNLARPVFAALGRLNGEIWHVVSQEVSEAGSLVYKDSPLDAALSRLPGEVQLALKCKYGGLLAWLGEHAAEAGTAWFRSSMPEDLVLKAVAGVRELAARDRWPVPVAVLLPTLGGDVAFLRFVLALCGLDLAVYGERYVARRPLGSAALRTIRIHLLLAEGGALSVGLPEIPRAYNRAYPDDRITPEIAEKCIETREDLFQPSGGAWVADGVETPTMESAAADEAARFRFERPWEETGALTIVQEVLETVESARIGEIVRSVLQRSSQRFSVPTVVAALMMGKTVVQVTPARFALRETCAAWDPVLAATPLLLNRKDCRRYILDRYAGEPLHSYPLWTGAMEREWCLWAERNSERNTGVGFGGKSDRAHNRRIYQSLLYVAEPDRWPVADAEKRAWAFKKACHAVYHFADAIPDAAWANPPTLQDLFGASALARQHGYLNWIRANRILFLEEHSPKAVPTLALLVALGFLAPAEHWQARHDLGPRMEQWFPDLVTEVRKKGFLHWRDDVGVALREQLAARAETGGWVEPHHVQRLCAEGEGGKGHLGEIRRRPFAQQTEAALSPVQEATRPRQFELPF